MYKDEQLFSISLLGLYDHAPKKEYNGIYVIGFLKAMTLKDYRIYYSPSSLDRGEYIGIDEFAVKKGIAIKIPAA